MVMWSIGWIPAVIFVFIQQIKAGWFGPDDLEYNVLH